MKLIATRPFKYKTRRLVAGDEFETSDKRGRLFVGINWASEAPEQAAPVQAPPAPVVAKLPPPAEQPAPDIDELREEAEALGIDVDGRWGVIRLQHEIAQAKQP